MHSSIPPLFAKVAGLAALIGLAACSNETGLYSEYVDFPLSQPGQLEDPTVTDRVVQVTTPEVDVLFVVDNSCSMSDNQAKLGEEFPTFLEFFLGSGLDYHIGVTSTDVDANYGNPLEGRLNAIGGVTYIDPSLNEEQATSIFSGMVSLGINGSGEEKGLASAFMALELRRDEPSNAGFYRDDAALHTVAVSDEQDQSDMMRPELITLPEFIDWYDGLKDVIEDRTFSSIVCSSAAGLAGGCLQFDVGTRYMTVSREIGGIVWDINDDNFSEVLEQLGVQASGFKREYFLTQAPIPETLDVRIERVVSGQTTVSPKKQGDEKTGDYYYNESRNSIVFHDFVPDPLDEVVISYTLLSAAQDPSYDVDLTDEVATGTE